MKGFRVLTYISSSSPKLTWRNHIDQRANRVLDASVSSDRSAKTAPRPSLMKLFKLPSQG